MHCWLCWFWAKVVDKVKSVVNSSEKICSWWSGQKSSPWENYGRWANGRKRSCKRKFWFRFHKKSLIKDAVEELRSPKWEDSVWKASEAIASEKSLKSSEIYSARESDGSTASYDKTDKIIQKSKALEALGDYNDKKSINVKDEHPQEISAKVEEKVDTLLTI